MAREIVIKIKVPTAEELEKVVKELEKMVAGAIKIEVTGKEKPAEEKPEEKPKE